MKDDIYIQEPDNEDMGMNLVQKSKLSSNQKVSYGVKQRSFGDYLKDMNHNAKLMKAESSAISSPSITTGASLARKASFAQPGQGKKAVGIGSSSSSALDLNPTQALDAKMWIEKNQDPRLQNLALKTNSDIETLAKLALSQDWTVDELIRRFASKGIKV